MIGGVAQPTLLSVENGWKSGSSSQKEGSLFCFQQRCHKILDLWKDMGCSESYGGHACLRYCKKITYLLLQLSGNGDSPGDKLGMGFWVVHSELAQFKGRLPLCREAPFSWFQALVCLAEGAAFSLTLLRPLSDTPPFFFSVAHQVHLKPFVFHLRLHILCVAGDNKGGGGEAWKP